MGNTALIIAFKNGHYEVAELLLKKKIIKSKNAQAGKEKNNTQQQK